MNQREEIQSRISFSEQQAKKAEQIQQLYLKCKEQFNDLNFSELIMLVDSYCIRWVRKKLDITGCYTRENEHEIMQEARIAVWSSISNSKGIREAFAYHAFVIYKYKTYDLIREVFNKNKNPKDSLDEPTGGDQKPRSEKEGAEQKDEVEQQEKRMMYDRIFQIYCSAFMNYKTFLPRSLALYYARVLPHLLHINHEEKTIPDTKKASAKWAIGEMSDHTVLYLTDHSEKLLQKEVAQHLKWSEDCRRQLEETVQIKDKETLLKDLVYTSAYDKGQVEDWADYMHKKAAQASISLVAKDCDLQNLVKEYISKDDGLYRFAEGGKLR